MLSAVVCIENYSTNEIILCFGCLFSAKKDGHFSVPMATSFVCNQAEYFSHCTVTMYHQAW